MPFPAQGQPWIVADIGGTNARFAWIEGGGISHVQKLAVADHPGLVHAVHAYLASLQAVLGSRYRAPRCAAFAVATSVADDAVAFTNSHWHFSKKAVQADLSLDAFLVLNDFEALALSLPRLTSDQLKPVRQGQASVPMPENGTLAVIGPGTGLGVGAVTFARQGWIAIAGEGGHATLSAADDFESALLAQARISFEHVSAERLLSGIGLPALHAAVAGAMGGRAAAALSTEDIVDRGLSGADPVCDRTLDVFCAMLGSFAGNVALTVGARAGVYIGGGIVPRLGERFFRSRFVERFESKGRFRGYLQQIPIALITDTLAALSGAALALEQLPAGRRPEC